MSVTARSMLPDPLHKKMRGAPMSKPAEYRENAALCLEAMRAAEVPEVKESLQSLAQRWIELADREERNSGRGERGGWANQAPQRNAAPWQRF
jgi:hypothetical protein